LGGTYYTLSVSETAAIADALSAITGYNVSCTETAAITSTETGRNLWVIIDDSQTANWQNIANSQTPGWTVINDAETANWSTISTV